MARPYGFLLLFRLLVFVLLMLSSGNDVSAQAGPPISEKAVKRYEKARELQESDPQKAEELLREAVEIAPDYRDAWAKLGDLLTSRGDSEEGLRSYEKALEIDPVSRQLVWFSAALAAMQIGRYEDASEKLRRFLALNPKNERQRSSALSLLQQAEFSARAVRNPVPFSPQRLGSEVNSSLPEYLPSLSADGLTLIFTRVVDNQEDFFICERESEHAPWSAARPLANLNTSLNEGAHCLSADGSTLVFTACGRPDGKGSCDLYISELKAGQWTSPVNLGSPVNSAAYETQPSLSADGRVLIFTARREGGLGNNDLWESVQDANGNWGKPRNLGAVINTPEDDQAPFLHPDGRTLYFMSKGHPGMGGFDLFVSRKNALGDWEPPQNLGFPVNSVRNEGAMVVSADGKTAYYARDQEEKPRPGIPLTDIWTFELYPEARPTPVTYVRGKVVDAQTREVLQASVVVEAFGDSGSGYRLPVREDGTFLVCLPVGRDYAFSVQQEGYLFFSEFFALGEAREVSDPYILDIFLQPILQESNPSSSSSSSSSSSAPVVLRNIFFASGSAKLEPASLPELQRLLKLLEENPRLHIQINGHTDDVGAEADNLELSTRRAEAVFRFLLDSGISPSRVKYAGFGETRPLAPNDSSANRSRNRRTEFVVLSQ